MQPRLPLLLQPRCRRSLPKNRNSGFIARPAGTINIPTHRVTARAATTCLEHILGGDTLAFLVFGEYGAATWHGGAQGRLGLSTNVVAGVAAVKEIPHQLR